MLIDVDAYWTLLPPTDPGFYRLHEQQDMVTGSPGERWIERYSNARDLAKRLAFLELAKKAPDDPESDYLLGAESGYLTDLIRKEDTDPEGLGEPLGAEARAQLVRWSRLRNEQDFDPKSLPEWTAPWVEKPEMRAVLLKSDDLCHGVSDPAKGFDSGSQGLRVLAPGAPIPVDYRTESDHDGWMQPLRRELRIQREWLGLLEGRESGPRGRCRPPTSSRADDPCWVETDVLRQVIRALLTRPFVLLAGVSGSGKTLLASHLGRAWAQGLFRDSLEMSKANPEGAVKDALEKLGGTSGSINKRQWTKVDVPEDRASRSKFGFVPVQSDWTDSSHLWGYYVPLPAEAAGFYATRATEVFLEAWCDPERSPALLLLDELNLSRPEHYGADLLSAMEKMNSPVIQLHRAGTAVPMRRAAQDSVAATMVPDTIGWAENLRVIGTVNVDETTFSFAPKVLDRAALLEFVHVDLTLLKEFDGFKDSHGTLDWLRELNKILRRSNLHIAYRAALEIEKAIRLDVGGGSSVEDARDAQVLNKVLPRIRGTRAAVETLLESLYQFIKTGEPDKTLADYVRESGADEVFQRDTAIRKIVQMYQRAQDVGFTSFFG